MKSNIRLFHPASVFFLLTVGAAFLSWVGSIYGWEDVQNLLSAEGLRWALRYTDDNYLRAPMLAVVLILFLGLGLCIHSRFPEACLRLCGRGISLSRKERRALGLTAVVLGGYVLFLALLAWGPWTFVRSITGDLSGSPLSEGVWCVVAFGLGLSGLVYGCATDFYRNDRDVVCGMAWCFSYFSSGFVTLFFVVQFFAVLDYTQLAVFVGIPESWLYRAYAFCCLLAFCVRRKNRDN